jgi:hypothetical protein
MRPGSAGKKSTETGKGKPKKNKSYVGWNYFSFPKNKCYRQE